MLPSLLELHSSYCQLDSFAQTLPSSINLTSLYVLDLNKNYFDNSSSFLLWWINTTTFTHLNLRYCDLISPVSQLVARQGCFHNLLSLDLSGNQFLSGEIEQLVDVLSRCGNVNLELLVEMRPQPVDQHRLILIQY